MHPEASRRVLRVPHAAPASRAVLTSFHTEEYLAFVEAASRAGRPGFLDAGDTPAFPGCYDAAAAVVGATLASYRAVEEGTARRAFQAAGGLHHAHPGRASGFCIFNDVAVAIASALDGGARRRRVAYIDLDAHHGDGVMYGFYRDGRLLDIDFHQDGRTLFPGTGRVEETGAGDGAGLKVNVPLPPGSGDDVLLRAFRAIVPTLLDEFKPEVIFIQHGVDGHVGDRLAQLQYTPAAYGEALERILGAAERLSGGRLVVTGGGGYRAENVARVLASAGERLAGLTVANETSLPSAWRREFSDRMDEPAPIDRTDFESPTPSPWGPDRTDRLIADLGRRLGRRFPVG